MGSTDFVFSSSFPTRLFKSQVRFHFCRNLSPQTFIIRDRVIDSRSDSEGEATTSEPLLRTGVLVNLARLHLSLGFALHSLAALLLVVLSLHLLKLTGEALDLVLVLVDLGLVHVEFGGHCLHLVGLLLQVLLVDGELLGDLGAGLSRKQVLKLNIELFLLLDGHVLLDDLLSLLDETFLERLDLEKKLEGVRVSALELSPSVVVERVLQLFR